MAESHYDWKNGPAEIDPHSLTKHEVLVGYLIRYFEQRTLNARGREQLRITLVDGFCGGGLYTLKGRGTEVLGSPLRMLDAVREARIRVNIERTKPIELDVRYIFIDKDARALSHLRQVLQDRGYGEYVGKTIHVIHDDFASASPEVFRLINAHTPRAQTALFFLDQYGYSEVPAPLIQKIFAESSKSEVVLTFHVSAFATYTNDDFTEKVADKLVIDIRSQLRGRTIEQIKEEDGADWRRFIQAALYQALVKNCGAEYFTPFFIRGEGSGQGEYWLVHLSRHPRAQDVMKQVHWEHQNHFIHYGGAGLDMLATHMMGFRQQFEGGFVFDDMAQNLSADTLPLHLAKNIFNRIQPVQIGELFSSTCNTSPSTSLMYKDALARLSGEKDIVIRSEDGVIRRFARYMRDTDWIERNPQTSLSFASHRSGL
ncbi:three-Cys-motif partner protein TcmP [Lampropedia puyangensis]|uniref:Three-Cys-motif partner protein TcmP n=1 Tax=Lampropedia puyangensis TaxID=1330072 RepID=A0A4S8ET46_9BURK|nr:three-Cys-motif partner protein TcmP [Lampropedia puyangensis]THT95451.1 three-Cys-motif partner protein TcmP [Lampropedia puyangensis]